MSSSLYFPELRKEKNMGKHYSVRDIERFVKWTEEAADFDKRLTALEEQLAGLADIPSRGTRDYVRAPINNGSIDSKKAWPEIDSIVAVKFKEKQQECSKELNKRKESSSKVLTERILFRFLTLDEATNFRYHVAWTIDAMWYENFISVEEFMSIVAGNFTRYLDPVMLDYCINADLTIGWTTDKPIAYSPYKSGDYYVVPLAYPKKYVVPLAYPTKGGIF